MSGSKKSLRDLDDNTKIVVSGREAFQKEMMQLSGVTMQKDSILTCSELSNNEKIILMYLLSSTRDNGLGLGDLQRLLNMSWLDFRNGLGRLTTLKILEFSSEPISDVREIKLTSESLWEILE